MSARAYADGRPSRRAIIGRRSPRPAGTWCRRCPTTRRSARLDPLECASSSSLEARTVTRHARSIPARSTLRARGRRRGPLLRRRGRPSDGDRLTALRFNVMSRSEPAPARAPAAGRSGPRLGRPDRLAASTASEHRAASTLVDRFRSRSRRVFDASTGTPVLRCRLRRPPFVAHDPTLGARARVLGARWHPARRAGLPAARLGRRGLGPRRRRRAGPVRLATSSPRCRATSKVRPRPDGRARPGPRVRPRDDAQAAVTERWRVPRSRSPGPRARARRRHPARRLVPATATGSKLRRGVRIIQLWHAVRAPSRPSATAASASPASSDPSRAVHKNYTHAIVSSGRTTSRSTRRRSASRRSASSPTGIPRMDRFFDERARGRPVARPPARPSRRPRGRTTILFAPTYPAATTRRAPRTPSSMHRLRGAPRPVRRAATRSCIIKMHPFVQPSRWRIPEALRDRLIDGSTARASTSTTCCSRSTCSSPTTRRSCSSTRPSAARCCSSPTTSTSTSPAATSTSRSRSFVPGPHRPDVRRAARRDPARRLRGREGRRRSPSATSPTSTAASTDRVIDQLILGGVRR